MERTKKPKRKEPESFFSDTQIKRTKQGMQSSVDNVVAGITNFMIPKLREAGYDGQIVKSADIIKKHKQKDYWTYSSIHPMLLVKNNGWWLEIWIQENPRNRMYVKPFLIKSTKPQYLQNRPRLNLPECFLEELKDYHQNIWIRTIWEKMFALDLHFLIMTETGMFWMDSFSSISDGHTIAGPKGVKKPKPIGWTLTYRNDPDNLDRIACKPEVQEGKFQSIKKSLRDTLLTKKYYWTKNNDYASK